jgi:hypothetical protein
MMQLFKWTLGIEGAYREEKRLFGQRLISRLADEGEIIR